MADAVKTKLTETELAIFRWQDAYRKANGKEAPHVTYSRGWYSISFSRWRLSDLNAATERLLTRAAALSEPRQ